MPKKINEDVKARGLRLLEAHAREYSSLSAPSEAIGKQLGVSKESVRRWANQAQVDVGVHTGVPSEESAEIKRLKAENR
ncbi:transposase-like protein [Tsukamurella ocularis]|nr:transposase-like protein [Tsukamurella ocularis]